MGLTKQYLRYISAAVFGITASTKCNIVFLDIHGTTGKYCAVGACENVLIWDLRKSEKYLQLNGEKSEVTKLAASPDKRHLAVGYNDGTIRVFDIYTGELKVTFSGHKSAISALNYHQSGMTLVSGSKDTEVVIWDIVAEAGLYRLRGHKGMITQARFLQSSNVLITSSKDTFVKCWDLGTQHCFSTLVGHKTEVWDFIITPDERRLITGSCDMELRVWDLNEKSNEQPDKKRKIEDNAESGIEEDDDVESEQVMKYICVGNIARQGKDRVVSMASDQTGKYFACHGADSLLEIFHLSSEEDILKRLKKREKKVKRKARELGAGDPGDVEKTLGDEIHRVNTVKLSHKLRAFDLSLDANSKLKLVALLTNNSLESFVLDVANKKPEAEGISKLNNASHRTDVRTVCFSSDNTAILSASGESVKIWNRASKHCIRTIACEYALSSLFVPGDRHVILGTKAGHLQLFDLGASQLLESIDAHSASVWSVCMAPDKKSIVSGSADREVKFWDFELISDEQSSKRLALVHTKTLKMSEEVLCVKYSPDQRLIAVALLDSTVKVFFVDTLKFFLSLYGHKLPVLSMDISYDSTLIVTASSDRNVKIWGLDYGDCHKSLFAHDDSVMSVQFVPKTHHFFTAGKDGKIKQWDADNFEHILTLEGHCAEVWCLAVSNSGNFVVSASHDRTLRLWEKTDEPLILEEEHEMERETEYEKATAQSGEAVIPGETNTETGIASKKTVESVRGAERIMEAIDLHREQLTIEPSSKEPVHPLFQAYGVSSSDRYVLEVLTRIKSSELDESLLILPFSYVSDLLQLLSTFLDNSWQVELSCRCLFFLLRVHHGQITSNQLLLPVIDKLRHLAVIRVQEMKDTIGLNMAALKYMQSKIERRDEVSLFVDATGRFNEKKKRNKKRAILTIAS